MSLREGIRRRRWAAPVALALLAGPGIPASAAAQELHVLVVTGLGGEARYRAAFHQWAVTILDAARERFGVPEERAIYLGERVETDPARIRDRSTRENVEVVLGEIGERSRPGDRVLVVLIGHGTASQDGARFNLPGPDPSAEEWGAMLEGLSGREVAFVNTASSSGDFIPALAGEGRIVVTATRSGREQNETVFPRYFGEALNSPDADLDKDGELSLLEAFEYARQEVARFYRDEGRIQTEIALLEDTGDGVGSRAPGVDGEDGDRARRFRMGGSGARAAAAVAADPALAPLLERRRGLEDDVAALRGERASLGEAEYERRLEELLVELALLSREIRERGGAP
jgi:hypothetical protein